MTIPYNLNLNWVPPIITALSMSTSPSILNLTSDLSHSISSSQIININTDNLINHDQDDEKPLDLTLKSFTTIKSDELTKKKLDNQNSKIPCRRKSNRTRTQTKATSSTTMKITNISEKLNPTNQDTQTNRQVEIIQQSESITSSSTNNNNNNINGAELCQNNWITDIQDSIQINESDQKRPRSTSSRRPFKAFGNTVPSISTELLLKSSKLIDPLLLVNTIDKSETDDDHSKSMEHNIEQKTTSYTPPLSPTSVISTPTTNGNNSKRKSTVKIKSRRSQKMTPSEVKDKAYWEKRVKNNEAARRSRRARKTKELSLKKYADNLEKVNLKLIEEIELLKTEILHLKSNKEMKKSNSN
ncbi:unnamed protein product [Schistosoma mattheei]|uniref:Uncharacterized protein n=1 Tax=Schistosoma mattheei TaxID=31246 RepID=A0A183PK64_9TREM|nr:unnamed protein product [Schistosoma mattheei]